MAIPPTNAWNAAYELVPDGGDSLDTGDDDFRDNKLDVRQRLENEHLFGPNAGGGTVSDTGLHREGSARGFFQAAAPGNVGDPSSTPFDSDNSDGRVWLMDGTGAYQPYVYDHSVPGFSLLNNIDPATMHDSDTQTTNYDPNSTALLEVLDAGAGAAIQATIVTPAVGLWMVEVWASVTIFGDNATARTWNAGIRQVEDPAGVATATDIILADGSNGTSDGQTKNHLMVYRATGLTAAETFDYRVLFQYNNAGGANDVSRGRIEAIVKPYGA